MGFKETTVQIKKWYRIIVGGMWDSMGRLQFDFLVKHGLKPKHHLLDVGCGALRGGVYFIKHLEAGHYYGVDIDDDMLEAALLEVEENGLTDKRPNLVRCGNFNFETLSTEFDYAVAVSVFTHLPFNSILKCLVNVEKTLKPEGCFYATFFENPYGLRWIKPLAQYGTENRGVLTFLDKNPYHYTFDTFKWVCEAIQLEVEYVGEWNHPRGQKMLKFTKAE